MFSDRQTVKTVNTVQSQDSQDNQENQINDNSQPHCLFQVYKFEVCPSIFFFKFIKKSQKFEFTDHFEIYLTNPKQILKKLNG